MQPDTIVVPWKHGEFTILKQGAMCAPATFTLDDGRRIQPFAIAPWEDDGSQAFRDLPPLLKRMRGEWVCVPFGMPDARTDLPDEWTSDTPLPYALGDWFHGPGSNLAWHQVDMASDGVTLELLYPEPHPIARLVRRISGSPNTTRLDFELEVHPREDCLLPVGLHPVFRLPDEPLQSVLTVDGDLTVFTYPVDAEPGTSKLPNGSTFSSLQSAQLADGTAVDLTRHPLPFETEELVLVAGVTGRATLDNLVEKYRVTINWDPLDFGCCNLWISNHGRTFYPWNGRFRALAIEPVSAPFDLGADVANAATTPLSTAGVPCAVDFKAGQLWSTRYSIEVTAI